MRVKEHHLHLPSIGVSLAPRSGVRKEKREIERARLQGVHVKRSDNREHSYALLSATSPVGAEGESSLVRRPCWGLARGRAERCRRCQALCPLSLGAKGWREGGRKLNGGEMPGRRRGRGHGDSVITFTLPDTAVRQTLGSYPPPLSLSASPCFLFCRNLSSRDFVRIEYALQRFFLSR